MGNQDLIGDLYHIFYTCPDLSEAERWWCDVLGAHFYKELPYLDSEKRAASFLRLAGETLEPMSVDEPADAQSLTPVQRFVSKFGFRWHSLAWFTGDMPELYGRLEERGVRMFQPGGIPAAPDARAVFTHPRDTFVGLEFAPAGPDGKGGDAAAIAQADQPSPAGVRELAWVTVLPRDRRAAVKFYVDVLAGTIVEESADPWLGTSSTYVKVGPTVIEFAEVLDQRPALGDGAGYRDVVHSLTFRVDDLDRVRSELESHGSALEADHAHLVTSPPSAPAARVGFTTSQIGVP